MVVGSSVFCNDCITYYPLVILEERTNETAQTGKLNEKHGHISLTNSLESWLSNDASSLRTRVEEPGRIAAKTADPGEREAGREERREMKGIDNPDSIPKGGDINFGTDFMNPHHRSPRCTAKPTLTAPLTINGIDNERAACHGNRRKRKKKKRNPPSYPTPITPQ